MPLEERDASKLRDIVTWARKAIFILGSKTHDEFMANEEKRLALVRCIEVVGESGHQVSDTVKSALPTVPWPAMWGMRNRLIHDYGNTNYPVVFDVVRNDLPGLAATIAQYLAENGHPI
jgi:uncharacterized protein with HEPN domain